MNQVDSNIAIDSATGLEVNLAIAGPGARSYAFVIDWHVRLLVALAWWIAAGYLLSGSLVLTPAGMGSKSYFLIAVLPALAIYMVYHPVLEIAMQGRTPGKRMAGVRIVTRGGVTPSPGALLMRNVFRLIDALPGLYCVGLAATVFTAEHVRIGDLAAGTLLVYDHTDYRSPRDAFAAHLSAAASDPKLAELVDDLLARWSALEQQTRLRLAQKLLARIDPQSAPADDEKELQQRLRAYLTSGG